MVDTFVWETLLSTKLLVTCCICTYTYMKMTIIISVTVLLPRVCNILFCTTVHNQTRICELFLQSNARVPSNSHNSTDTISSICIGQIRYEASRIASVSKQESISNNLIPFEFFWGYEDYVLIRQVKENFYSLDWSITSLSILVYSAGMRKRSARKS